MGAHQHAPVRREVIVRVYARGHSAPGHCWKLLNATYGLRDAGAASDQTVEPVREIVG